MGPKSQNTKECPALFTAGKKKKKSCHNVSIWKLFLMLLTQGKNISSLAPGIVSEL